MAKGTVVVKFLGDASQLNRTMTGVEKGTGKLGAGLKVAAAAVVGGFGYALKGGLDQLESFGKGQALLTQGLKSTRDASGETVKGMEDLADNIQDYSGQTRDSIVNTEQLLLTFQNLRNGMGKGNDIFTRTTKLAADMAARFGGDASSQAVKLGKALNDPVKGLSSLTRVGVTFTAAQQKQIKALVAGGKTMQAQKVILGALDQKFAGSAKAVGDTLPGKIAKLKNSWNDMTRQLAAALLPALIKATDWLEKIGSWVQKNKGWLLPLVAVLGSFAATVLIVTKAIELWTAAQELLDAAMDANPVVLVIAAVVALGVALVVAYKKSQTFRDVVNGVFNAIKTVVGDVVGFITKHWKLIVTLFAGIVAGPIGLGIAWMVTHLGDVKSIASAVANFFTGPFLHGIGLFISTFIQGLKDLANVALDVFGWIVKGGSTMLGWVPIIGPKLKKAAADFAFFKEEVTNQLSQIATSASALGTKTGNNFGNAAAAAIHAKLLAVAISLPEIGGDLDLRTGVTTARTPGGKAKGSSSGSGTSTSTGTTSYGWKPNTAHTTINVYNPVPEKASDTVAQRLRELAYVHGMAFA
ncbi:MAG TPA: hypothetical protein VG899_12440 [Mycobacteriales bacterium]|nr:hypothetical protein [Mycobacteriales bacterium]